MDGRGRGGDAYSHPADHGSVMIAASRLRKSYGSTAVLEDVSFELAAGQCLALLGPNGAGKTTILRILATLLRPTSGTLALAGVDALKEPEAARALIGVVAHGSYIYEDLSALENLRFWTVMAGVTPRRSDCGPRCDRSSSTAWPMSAPGPSRRA